MTARAAAGRRGKTRANAKPDTGTAPATEMPGLAARRAAARLLAAVVDARTSLDGLTDSEHGNPQFMALEPRDRSLVRAILAAALRHRLSIGALIDSRLDRPLPAKAGTLLHILHVAAAQILFLDIPDSAAVNLAVAHAGSDPRTRRFAGLVNAVLRAMAARKERALPKVLAATRDTPDWFAKRLLAAYGPETADAIMAAHRIEAPLDLTVRTDPGGWAQRLGGRLMPNGTVRLVQPGTPVPELAGYAEGAWWVQDAAASLPARLLGAVDGSDVADLCAAPGGKTAQLANAGARVTAVDGSANRLRRLAVNLERLGLSAEIVRADLATWRPARLFDAVLLDAPCSATGTLRRHPDIAWTKTPEDIARLAAAQRRLLDAASALVRPGGRLVFSNCSLDPEEGEQLVACFLGERHDFNREPVGPAEFDGLEGLVNAHGDLRTTPADWPAEDPRWSGMDGFFATRLRRTG